MGFKLKVDGTQAVDLGVTSLTKMEVESYSPEDSNARSTDFGMGIKVWGKINYTVGGSGDATVELNKWSLVSSDKADCYRNVTAEVIAASDVIRQYTLPNAFVVEYSESFDEEQGVGIFYLHVRQKKDLNANIKIEGGYAE